MSHADKLKTEVIEAHLKLRRAAPAPQQDPFELDVALQLPGTGVTALFGPSGCGKTTLLRALAGLERAAGRVLLGSQVWQDDRSGQWLPTHERPLGYVIQEAALFPHLDVQGNLNFGLKRVDPAARRVQLEPAIELLGIAPLMARRPLTLSGGERQRVAIARALATSPSLLLMDEPLAALDARRKAELLPYLDRLHSTLQIPIVYVSHALDEVVRLADHLVLLASGRVTASGPLATTLARLDLQPSLGEGAGVVLHAVVTERDAHWHLARLDIGVDTSNVGGAGGGAGGGADGGAGGGGTEGGATLWARDPGHAIGHRVRVRVLARDVSLARSAQTGTSIGNQWPATVEALVDDEHPALTLVRVRLRLAAGHAGAADVPLLARLTRRSAQTLELAPGMPVWAMVKTVALLE